MKLASTPSTFMLYPLQFLSHLLPLLKHSAKLKLLLAPFAPITRIKLIIYLMSLKWPTGLPVLIAQIRSYCSRQGCLL